MIKQNHHDETISAVVWRPSLWALRDITVLRMNSHNLSGDFANSTSRNVGLNGLSSYWSHHGIHSLASREPERIIITTANVASLLNVTEQEWHCVEFRKTRSRRTKILTRSSAISLDIEERITGPQLSGSRRTLRNFGCLRVLGESKSS